MNVERTLGTRLQRYLSLVGRRDGYLTIVAFKLDEVDAVSCSGSIKKKENVPQRLLPF